MGLGTGAATIGAASQRWRELLAAVPPPPELVASAPECPYGFSVALFSRRADDAAGRRTPSRARALEALTPEGTVLDVGCGAGAACLALAEAATAVTGVDPAEDMLSAFAARAQRLGIPHREVRGSWPEAAAEDLVCDVCVCHHVVYNVPELAGFAAALTRSARRAVVVEMTAEHPVAWMRPLWMRLHGLAAAPGPDAADALAVLADAGIQPTVDRWWDASPWLDAADDLVAFVRRRLCVGSDRDADIRAALSAEGLPRPRRELVTLRWSGAADRRS